MYTDYSQNIFCTNPSEGRNDSCWSPLPAVEFKLIDGHLVTDYTINVLGEELLCDNCIAMPNRMLLVQQPTSLHPSQSETITSSSH